MPVRFPAARPSNTTVTPPSPEIHRSPRKSAESVPVMSPRRTDIHFHLLPGVDDGPATLDESIELARAAVRDGTDTIVATSHVRSDYVTDVALLRDRAREVKEALARENVPVSVELGGELGHDMVGRLRQDDLEAIAHGPPRRRWLLVEAPFAGLDPTFNAAADELRDRGFGV